MLINVLQAVQLEAFRELVGGRDLDDGRLDTLRKNEHEIRPEPNSLKEPKAGGWDKDPDGTGRPSIDDEREVDVRTKVKDAHHNKDEHNEHPSEEGEEGQTSADGN